MAQLAQSWNRIPYDVWERIFDLFDKQTLLSACLVNLTIHDIASRSLYATLIINKGRGYHMWRSPAERKDHFKDAFLAFDRKPDLRLVVKDVILYPSAITAAWFHNNADNIDMDCYAQLQKLLNVRKVTLNGRFGSKELDHFLDSMSTLALLESLVITDPISRRFDGTLSLGPSGDYKKLDRIQDLSLSFAGNELDSWVVGSIASKIKKLTLESYDSTGIGYRLEALLRLQKLDITMSSPDPMKLCETVAVSKDLTQITLEFIWPKWEVVVPDITMDLPDTGLAKLTSLTIRLRSRWGDKEIKLLQNLVPALAGRSRLRKLAIVGPNSYPPYTHIQCHHLMAHVISVHGPTLEKLKVPFFHMSKAILERIMARCEKLKILWAPAREELRVISTFISVPSELTD
ncbi:hypothetical protein FRB91_011408 [Serendipita sp. 411]|nr:hypothetical protein FRB91_011408 [Serendipita sp. 411]